MSKQPLMRKLLPGDEPALEAFLLPRIDTSMFLLGNMRTSGLVDHGQPYEGTYIAAFEEDKIVGVVGHFWNKSLIFQAPEHLDVLWREAVAASGRGIKGLIGPAEQVASVMDALSPIEESNIQMYESEYLYSLALQDLRVPELLQSGAVTGRRMAARDLETAVAWRISYAIETLGEEAGLPLYKRSRDTMQRSLDAGRMWVLESQGELVAMSGFNSAIKEAVQVGGVWTPPELRRRGYARCAVAVSLLDAREDGVEKAILFTGEDNVPAQTAYKALGFRLIGRYCLVSLKNPVEL
ncbi:MAG: GNAT family N-acetyltransferase [Anaerolineae bacterium]|nr:GNAT family N-acetyltransferase [Anaerolineae bacterium]